MLFIFPIVQLFLNKQFNILKKNLIIGAGMTLIFIIVFCTYNFFRFNDPLETGHRHVQGAARYDLAVKENKIFSLENIPHNISIEFLKPVQISIQEVKPYLLSVDPDIEGNSIFSVYPLILFAFYIFNKRNRLNKKFLFFATNAIIVIGFSIFLILSFLGTGWTQFGARYYFDVIPLIYLLVLSVLDRIPKPLVIFVVIYGVTINIMGSIAVYKLLYH